MGVLLVYTIPVPSNQYNFGIRKIQQTGLVHNFHHFLTIPELSAEVRRNCFPLVTSIPTIRKAIFKRRVLSPARLIGGHAKSGFNGRFSVQMRTDRFEPA